MPYSENPTLPIQSDTKMPVNVDPRSTWRRVVGFDEAGLLFAFVAMLLVIGIPYPDFFNAGSLEAVLRQASFIAIISFGMVFLVAMVEIDLSVSGIYSVAAMSTALLVKDGGDPWVIAILALAGGAVLGALNGVLSNVLKVPLIIVSLGMMSVYLGINLIISHGAAVYGMPREHSFFAVMGGNIFGLPTTVWAAAVVGAVLHVVLRHTRYGATVRGIGSNIVAAEFLGIRVQRLKVMTTALVGFLAALSGLLTLAFFKTSETSIGMGIELRVVAAVVIGGTSLAGGSGTIIGAAIGTLIITLIDSGLVFYGVDPNYSQFVTGIVIIAAIAMDQISKRRRSQSI